MPQRFPRCALRCWPRLELFDFGVCNIIKISFPGTNMGKMVPKPRLQWCTSDAN